MNTYDQLLAALIRVYGTTSTVIYKEAIALGATGSRNATTGWRTISYTESTIAGIVLPRGRGFSAYPPGFHPTNDFEGFSATSCAVGDQWKDAANNYFLITNAVACKIGGAAIQYYAYDLKLLSEWQAASGAVTMASGLDDPRERMKLYIDTYCDVNRILKDDDSTKATWAAIFDNPPYPLHLEFRHGTTPVQGLYVCGRTKSTPLIDHNLSAYAYDDDALVDICTVDSTGCAGWGLAWRMERELRYQLETIQSTNIRLFVDSDPKPVDIGGMWMYDLQCHINYERSKTA